jgi:hypothetical protein
MKFTSRSAVLSFASSALHPDFRVLWKVSIFLEREPYPKLNTPCCFCSERLSEAG